MCLIFHNFSLFPFFFFFPSLLFLKHPVEWDENLDGRIFLQREVVPPQRADSRLRESQPEFSCSKLTCYLLRSRVLITKPDKALTLPFHLTTFQKSAFI